LLEVRGVSKRFGGLKALTEVSFRASEGKVSAVIGPNGAGKTTLLNVISGIYPLDGGEVRFSGEKIHHLSPSKIARRGISRTFQHVELFGGMTAVENIMVGRYMKTRSGFFSSGLRLPWMLKEEREIRKKSEEILEYVRLTSRKDELAVNLPIGEQRTLEIARSLATEPRLLLLDEPAAGLNIRETRDLGVLIGKMKEELGITMVLVEHDMDLVMHISDWITVLNFGEVIAEGTPPEVQRDPEVIAVYLGSDEGGEHEGRTAHH
jgi:branched-chain amino acid transport system ATP-binding protein